jgi:hypothetical protein
LNKGDCRNDRSKVSWFPESQMKQSFSVARIAALSALLVLASAITALAQAAVPTPTVSEPSPSPGSTEQDQSASPSLPSVEQLDEMFKQTPLGKAADEARLHAQWRGLSNRTLNEADLISARAHAEAASTDLEKRQRLRAYYTTYFDRMRSRANSQDLKDFIDARKTEQLALLAQDRVRPGSSPIARPSPSAPPKGKHKKLRAAPEPALPQ